MKDQYKPYRKEESQIKGKFHPRRPKSRKEEQEFGPGKEDYVVCPRCYCLYFDKSWHHGFKEIKELKQEKRIKFKLCPACKMIKDNKYEGEVVIENPPKKAKKKIKNLAKNFGQRAFEEDPMDRIISIKERKVKRATNKRKRGKSSRKEVSGLDIRILTTENQLATRLAEKINEIFGRKLSLEIKHSHREDTARIRIRFPD